MRPPRLRPRRSHLPSSRLKLELELPSLASKPSCFFWFERHVIHDRSGGIQQINKEREIYEIDLNLFLRIISLLTLFCFVYNELFLPPRPKYLVLSSFVQFLPLEMHPPVHVGASRPEQFTICKIQELNDYRLPKPRGHQIYVYISTAS